MSNVLILGDSQIERVWNNVRFNREILRAAHFVPVKNRNAMISVFQAIKPAVSQWELFRHPISYTFNANWGDFIFLVTMTFIWGVLPNFALTFFLQIQIVILSFLTNIICDHLHEDSSDGDLQQLFSELFTNDGGIFTFCLSFPTVRVFLAPPNVRMKPAWYSRMRPSIIRTFHQFLQSGPVTLQGIEDFSGDFERDQVHYTILSGIYFVQHLADRVSAMLVEPVPSKSIRWYFWLCVLTV